MELRVDSHLKMQHRRRPKSPRKNKDKVNESPKELSISWPSIKRTSSWPQQTSSSTIKPITPRLKACLLWVLSRVKTAEISSKSKTKLVLDNWTKRRNKIIIKSMDRKFISMLPCCKMKAIRLTLERKDRYHNRKTFLSYPRIWFSHRIRIVGASSSHLFNRVLRLWLDHKLLVRRTKLSRARRENTICNETQTSGQCENVFVFCWNLRSCHLRKPLTKGDDEVSAIWPKLG